MPFTLCHPAAVLPLARFRLPFSALVVGSMAPDFLYFLPPFSFAQHGHTIVGAFLFCLPAGAVALAIFHGFLKRPLLDLLPRFLRCRLATAARGFRCASEKDAARIASALVLGAFTHLLWDSFTHGNGWGVARVPVLRSTLAPPLDAIPLFKALQHGSSIFGALALFFAACAWWKNAPRHDEQFARHVTQKTRVLARIVLGFAPLVIAFTSGFQAMKTPGNEWLLEAFARRFAVVEIGATCVFAFLYSTWWHFCKLR